MITSKLTQLTAAAAISLLASTAQAALVLTIDSYTTDEVSLTISGTFDTDTIGDFAGVLAIKNAWSSTINQSTDWFSGDPTVTFSSIQIDGLALAVQVDHDTSSPLGDSVFYVASPNPFAAGTEVSGSLTLTGAGVFDVDDAATLELVSGYSETTGNWARLEAVATTALPAVPLPAGLPLMAGALGLVGLVARRRSRA